MDLVTERVLLRPIRITDKDALYEYRCDPVVNNYQGWIPRSLTDVEVFIQGVADEINVPGTWFQFIVEEREHRVIVSIDPQNKPSTHLVARPGFRKEAHFKESLFLDGKWIDDLIYAMLRKDWIKDNKE